MKKMLSKNSVDFFYKPLKKKKPVKDKIVYGAVALFSVFCFFNMGKSTVGNFEAPPVQAAQLEAPVQIDENVQFLNAYFSERKIERITYLQHDGHSLKIQYLLENGQELEVLSEKSPLELTGALGISKSVVDGEFLVVSTDPKLVDSKENLKKIADIEKTMGVFPIKRSLADITK